MVDPVPITVKRFSQQAFLHEGFHTFNVTLPIRKWLHDDSIDASNIFGVKIRLFTIPNERPQSWTIYNLHADKKAQTPILVIYSNFRKTPAIRVDKNVEIMDGSVADDSTDRAKRTVEEQRLDITFGDKSVEISDREKRTSDGQSGVMTRDCHLQHWYLNFAEINWTSWIIQPRGFFPNICTGNCQGPHVSAYLASHAFIRNIYRTFVSPEEAEHIPKSSCVPTAYKPLHVMYIQNGTVLIRKMRGWQATDCGCF